MNKTRLNFLCIALLLFSISVFADSAKPTTVILVRHAEKVADTDDPELSAAGKARATELVRVLGSAGITAIYSSPYIRTRTTAAPLAEHLKLKVTEMDAKNSPAFAKDILSKHPGEFVFVSGHSNTVPEIITALGASVPEIEDWEFDNLYVVTVTAPGKATVARLKYGVETKQ